MSTSRHAWATISRMMLALLMLTATPLVAMAQQQHPAKPNHADRQRWEQEMRKYKTDFISNELGLTNEQREKFVPLYTDMDTQIEALNAELRKKEQTLRQKGDAATDAEYDRLAREEFELRGRENRIEMSFYPKFRTVLTSRQLYRLKHVERKFMRQLMNMRQGNGRPARSQGQGQGEGHGHRPSPRPAAPGNTPTPQS